MWLVILFLLLFLHLLLYCKHWKARRNFRHLPTQSQLPFIGTMHWYMEGGRAIFRCLKEASQIMDEKNLPFVAWIGSRPLLLLSNLEDMKAVTNSYIEKTYVYKFGNEWFGNGLVTATGEIWKKNIKKLAGSFTNAMVDDFQDTFNEKAVELLDILKERSNKDAFDAMPLASYITFSAVCQTAFGVNYYLKCEEIEDYYKAFVTALELLIQRGLNLIYHFDTLYRLSNSSRKFLRCVAVMHNISDIVIKKKIHDRENNRKKLNEETNEGPPPFKTFLDVLLDMSEKDPDMTQEKIAAEVQTIIVAGQETTATALCYSLLMLGCNRRIQEKLYHEVNNAFKNKTSLAKDDLANLVYCEAVILETLRLFPPIPIVGRYADREINIQSCIIPEGTVCYLNLYGAGRSQRIWGADADQFVPERWLPPRSSNAASFVAFSTGRRACIGKKYAMALVKTLLAHCVNNLEFMSEAENIDFTIDIALRAIEGNLLQVKTRDMCKSL